MADLQKLRPVGRLEQYSTSRGYLGLKNNVGVSGIYRATDTCMRSIGLKALLYHALARVVRGHPILAAVPLDIRSPNPYLARLPRIDLDKVIEFVVIDYEDSSHLDAMLAKQHNQPFELDKADPQPFWKLLVLTTDNSTSVEDPIEEFALCFIYHHAIGDGLAGATFHQTTIAHLSAVAREMDLGTLPPKASRILEVDTNIKILPSIEDIAAANPTSRPKDSAPQTLLTTVSPNKTQPGQDHAEAWTGPPTFRPVATCLQTLLFPFQATSSLTAPRRQNHTSLTATLQTLLASVLLTQLPASYTHISGLCPVSLRPWIQHAVPPVSLGTYITCTSTSHARGPFSWDEARRVKDELNAFVARDLGALVIGTFAESHRQRKIGGEGEGEEEPSFDDMLLAQLGREREAGFEVSNLGFVRGVDGDVGAHNCGGANDGREKKLQTPTWTLGRMIFTQSASAFGSAVQVGAVTGPSGELCVSFVWQTGVVSKDFVGRLVEGVRDGGAGLLGGGISKEGVKE